MRRTKRLELVEPFWEKQVGESVFQYNLFLQFKDIKMAGGTIRVLQKKLGRSESFIKQAQVISSLNRWPERIGAYLNYLNSVELEEQEAARREMVRRQAANGVKFQTKAMEMLEKLTQNLDADDVCRLIEVGVKMERTARGAPTEITAQAPIDRYESREERMARLKEEMEDIDG